MENGRNPKNGRFEKGHKESQIDKLKRITAMKEAWKNRADYIGDLISDYPKIYNSFRAIRFTDKGKKAGCCEEWKTFKTFFWDVIESYKDGLVFRRIDNKKPWSKNNFIWCTSEEAKYLKGDMIELEYKNEILPLKDIADKYNVNLNGLKYRYYHKKDYTIEEIIFGRRIKRNSKPVKDADNKQALRAKASKMISAYRSKDNKRGLHFGNLTIDWMINNIISKPCIYCGDNKRIGCDRIDNSLGHTKENIVPCCYECNIARGNNFTYEEMLVLGRTIKHIKNNRNANKSREKMEEA